MDFPDELCPDWCEKSKKCEGCETAFLTRLSVSFLHPLNIRLGFWYIFGISQPKRVDMGHVQTMYKYKNIYIYCIYICGRDLWGLFHSFAYKHVINAFSLFSLSLLLWTFNLFIPSVSTKVD